MLAEGRVTFSFAGMVLGLGLASGSLGCGCLVSSTGASTASAIGDIDGDGILVGCTLFGRKVLGCAFVSHVRMFERLMVILLLFAGKLVL